MCISTVLCYMVGAVRLQAIQDVAQGQDREDEQQLCASHLRRRRLCFQTGAVVVVVVVIVVVVWLE